MKTLSLVIFAGTGVIFEVAVRKHGRQEADSLYRGRCSISLMSDERYGILAARSG